MACSIGFISGFLFSEVFQIGKREYIREIVRQQSQLDDVFHWFKLVLISKSQLEDLELIESMEDVEFVKNRVRDNGKRQIRMFQIEAEEMRQEATNAGVIDELSSSIDEIKIKFDKGS